MASLASIYRAIPYGCRLWLAVGVAFTLMAEVGHTETTSATGAANVSIPGSAETSESFAEACDKPSLYSKGLGAGNGRSRFYMFGSERDRRIHKVEEAAQRRNDSLKSGVDPLEREITIFRKLIKVVGEQVNQLNPNRDLKAFTADLSADIDCFSRYVAFLDSVDVQSLELLKRQMEQASAARIIEQRQAREAAQRLRELATAEAALRQKEAEIIAQEAEEARQQREAASIAAQKKVVEDAAAREERERPLREAQAKAATATAEQEHLKQEIASQAAKQAEAEKQEEAEKLPPCASSEVLTALKGAVADSPAGKTVGLRVLGIENPVARSLDLYTPKRFCSATLITSAGTDTGSYTVRWADKLRRTFWVELTL
jgi:hypothetical protein